MKVRGDSVSGHRYGPAAAHYKNMTTPTARQPRGIPVGGQFAATSHAEPSLALGSEPEPVETPKKKSSKGVTTTVTLPDGTKASRTSKNGNYTHAVVVSAQIPAKVRAVQEANIVQYEENLKVVRDALAAEKLPARIKQRFRDKDPDVGYDGKPSYNGFEAWVPDPRGDGKGTLASTWCNSKGVSQGVYNRETREYDREARQHATVSLRTSLLEREERLVQSIQECRDDIEAIDNGTFKPNGPGVCRWTSREDLGRKAASGEFAFYAATRDVTVVPVD